MTTQESQFITVAETAQRLGLSVPTVRRMIARGEIPARRFGKRTLRVPVEALAAVGRPVAAWASA